MQREHAVTEISESLLAATRYFRKVYGFVSKKVDLQPDFVRVRAGRADWELEFSDASQADPIVVFASPDITPASVRSNEHFSYSVRLDGTSAAGIELATRIAIALGRAPVLPPENARRPVSRNPVFVSLASLCDRGCIFCGTNHRRVADPDATPWAALTKAEGEAGASSPDSEWSAAERQLRDARAFHNSVNWSGNDPVSSPIFDDALRLAHQLGYEAMSIQAPGTRLADPEYTDHLHSLGVRVLSLTCHGPTAEVFDYIGGKEGAYELFWATVANADRLGWAITFQVPIIAANVAYAAATIASLLPVRNANITLFYWHPELEFTAAIDALPLDLDGVAEALEEVPESKDERWVTVSGVPACGVPLHLLTRHQWDVDGHHYPNEDRGYAPQCERCAGRETCVGYPISYWLRYHETEPLGVNDPRLRLLEKAAKRRQ